MPRRKLPSKRFTHQGAEPLEDHRWTIHKKLGYWFGSAENAFEHIRLRLYYFGYNENIGRDEYGFHVHPHAEFLYTLGGEGTLLLEERDTVRFERCKAGHLHVAVAGVKHASRWSTDRQHPWRHVVLQFDLEKLPVDAIALQKDQALAMQFAPFYEYFFLKGNSTIQIPRPLHDLIHRELDRILRESNEYKFAIPSLILAAIMKMVGLFSHHLRASGLASGEGIVLPLSGTKAHLARAKEMLRDPAHDKTPIRDIARQVGISLYHFIRLFGKQYGCTPEAFRRMQIMERAGKMLIQTDEPIYLIAEKAGFENASAFSKAFSKRYRMTPAEFRASYAKS